MTANLCRVLLACVLAAPAVFAVAAPIESRPLQFAKGASSVTIKGSLKGDQTIDYMLRARAGQTMSVKLTTGNTANYFNVLPPGSKDVAIFVGSTEGNEWTGTLPGDGEYAVRVYLIRSAARRNEIADYTLSVGITGTATAPAVTASPVGDAKVKGTPFHGTGQVPCSMGGAPAGSAQCQFGVIRGNAGNAEVRVTPAGGLTRVLIFSGGKVSAEGSSKVKVARDGDLWLIDVNDYEHYRVPDAVVSGG